MPTNDSKVPNAETLEAIDEVKTGQGTRYKNVETLLDDVTSEIMPNHEALEAMDKNKQEDIESLAKENASEIDKINDSFIGEVIGVSQAIGELKEALDKIDHHLDERQFEKASKLGYDDVASAFIFLQRALGGLNDTNGRKQELIQDIAQEVGKRHQNIAYEEVASFVENKMESLTPIKNPMKIEILVGEKTAEKLCGLEKIRHTPIEHLAERIVASAMKNDEKSWQELESNEPPIPNIKREEKSSYTIDEVSNHMEARAEQHRQRRENLY